MVADVAVTKLEILTGTYAGHDGYDGQVEGQYADDHTDPKRTCMKMVL